MQSRATWFCGVLAAGLLAAVLLPDAAFAICPREAGRGLAAMTCGFLESRSTGRRDAPAAVRGWGFTLGSRRGSGLWRAAGVGYEFVTAPFPLPAATSPPRAEFPWATSIPRRAASS